MLSDAKQIMVDHLTASYQGLLEARDGQCCDSRFDCWLLVGGKSSLGCGSKPTVPFWGR